MPKRLVFKPSSTMSSSASTSTPSDSSLSTPTSLISANPTISTTFTDTLPLPGLIVFDLDYTLWPFWVDTHVSPPLRPSPSSPGTSMRDATGEHFTFYSEVPAILAVAKERGIKMGLASRSHTPDLARTLLSGLTVPSDKDSDNRVKAISLFPPALQQIYPGSKVSHFRKMQVATRKMEGLGGGAGGVAYEDMLFFDDEGRNRNVESELGVVFWLVRDGVSVEEVDRGVREWRRRRGKTT